jgi:hypothetical protein
MKCRANLFLQPDQKIGLVAKLNWSQSFFCAKNFLFFQYTVVSKNIILIPFT